MKRFLSLAALFLVLISSLFCAGDKESLALVLSGGGERALAEIPVLQELDRRGIVPDLIVGSGTGALVGGLYAAGYTGDEIEALLTENNLNDMLFNIKGAKAPERPGTEFLDYDAGITSIPIGNEASMASISEDKYLKAFLERSLVSVSNVETFDKLPVPFLATGTDVTNGKLLVFTSGSLPFAIRASMATPLYIDPVMLEDGTLVMDGGLLSNIPVLVAKDRRAGIILAVDVNDTYGIIGERELDMSSLQGVMQAWNEYLIGGGAEEAYESADWVIISDTAGYPMLGPSSNAEKILQKGHEAVSAAEVVFDELEERLGRKDRVLYQALPLAVASRLVVTDLLPVEDASLLKPFLGKELNEAAIASLEETLSAICEKDGLKSVSYSVRNGALVIEAEEYPSMRGEIGLGFNGRIGLYYNGDTPYLGYYPEVSAEGFIELFPGLDLDFGGKVGEEGLRGYTGLSYPFLSQLELFGFVELQYGGHFWKSIMGFEDYDFSNSLGSRIAAGVDLSYGSMMRMEALLGYDFAFVTKNSSDGLGRLTNHYLFLGLGFKLDAYDNRDASSEGVDFDLRLSFGIDLPDSFMGYEIEAELTGAVGLSDYFKFLVEAEFDSLRRPTEYSSAWAITKTGTLTPDYAYVLGGVLIPLPASLYLSCGIYLEASASDAEDYYAPYNWKLRKMIPFSTLDEDGLGVGGKIGFGFQTSFGQVGAELYLSDSARVTFLVGIE